MIFPVSVEKKHRFMSGSIWLSGHTVSGYIVSGYLVIQYLVTQLITV